MTPPPSPSVTPASEPTTAADPADAPPAASSPEPTGVDAVTQAQPAPWWRMMRKPKTLATIAGVVVLALAGLNGGLADADRLPHAPAPAAVGEPVKATPLTATVLRAYWTTDTLDRVYYREEGRRGLLLVVDLTGASDAPVDLKTQIDAFRIDAPGLFVYGAPTTTADARPSLTRLDDGLGGTSLQPGLTTPTVLVWSQDSAVPAPTQLELTIKAHVWRDSILTGQEGWHDPFPFATVTIPVKELPQ